MITIVKVQQPLFPKGAPHLVYNKDRSVVIQCPMDDASKKMLGNSLKAYFEADISNGKVHLIKRVPDQNW